MRTKILLVTLLVGVFSLPSYAEELTIADGTITTAIEGLMPVDRIESHPAGFGKLYCYTRVTGARADSQVTHVWYYQNNEMARVKLPVRSSDWRTYSSKRFLPQWRGEWEVVVLDDNQNKIARYPFRLVAK